MPNRAERRAMMREQTKKNKALIADYSKQQRIAGLIQNGITAKDLDEAYERGRKEGFNQASWPIIKCCHAGICIALHDEFGFDNRQCYEALKAVDDKIIYTLNHSKLADEMLEKTGIRLRLDEPFDRVQMAEPEEETA